MGTYGEALLSGGCFARAAIAGEEGDVLFIFEEKSIIYICLLCSASMPSVAIIQHHSKALYVVNDVKGGVLALGNVASTMC